MANEYNPVQTVAPPTASPDNFISTRANPEAFGSQVGQATQKLGATGEEVANQQMAVVMQLQQMDNEQTANKAAMSYADYVMKQETALRQNQGQNAADALPGFEKGMQDQMANSAASIRSPLARNSFLQDARNFYSRTMSSAGSFVADEIKKGVTQSYIDKAQSVINFTAAHVDQPGALDQGIQQITDISLSEAQHKGITDPDSAHAIVQKNVGDLVSSAIIAKQGQGGNDLQARSKALQEARDMLDKYQDQSIPGSPGVPIIDDLHRNHLQATLNNTEFTISSRADTEIAHGVAERVLNDAKIDFQDYINKNPQLKNSEDGYVRFTDFLQQHLQDYNEKGRSLGKDATGRDVIGNEAAGLTETRLRTLITNQNEADKVSVNKLQDFIFNPDHPVTSEREVLNSDNASYWKDLSDRRPAVIKSFRKLFNANAAGKQLTFGTDFYKHFSDMATRLEGDDKPKSENYMNYVGPTRTDPLTNSGYKALTDEMNYALQSPEGAAFVHSEKQYLEKLRGEIVGGLNIHNVNGERIFNLGVIQAMKKIQKGRESGLTADQLFDPNSKDYVGGASSYDGRSPSQKTNDLITIQSPMPMNTLVPQPKEKFDIKKIDAIKDNTQMKAEIRKALDAKNMSYDEAEAYLVKRGIPKAVPTTGLVPQAGFQNH